MPAGTVVNSTEDAVAVILEIIESAQHEIEYLSAPSFLSFAGTYDTMQSAKRFIEKGGVIRGIVPVSRANLEGVRLRLDIGEDLRHSDQLPEVFMFVGDRKYSISAMNIGIQEYTRDTPFTAFWSEDLTYAEYLLASFESAWSEAVPAAERIQEL